MKNSLLVLCEIMGRNKSLFLQFIQDTAKISQPYKTFPMVFCNGWFVGGFTEAKVFHEKSQFTTKRDF
jgi:hypothetical protein